MKLSAVSGVVKGKRAVMIDDSIVRGTTSRRIVKLLKEAGATESMWQLQPSFGLSMFLWN